MSENDTTTTQTRDTVASLRQELETQKALWRELVECVPAGVMVLDKAGNIRHLNRNMTAMFDIKSRNAVGQHYADILPDAISEEIRQMRAEAMEKGCVINRTIRHSVDKAITIDLGTNATLFKNGGEPLVIFVCHDRTAVNELERLRTLDAKKTESISRTAHELKNPLSAIKAYCEVLEEMYTADGTASGFLKGIDDEAEHLLHLVGELLNVSSIESGRMQLTLDELDLADVARETLYNIDMTNKKHRLILRTEENVPLIVADQVMIKEVITNLVANAIKFSPRGGDIIIEIHKQGRNIRMDVIDQGLGIPKEHLANIFEKFYRVFQPDHQDIPGCGLGLPIVKGIVEAHKGTITVESRVGAGSKFSVILPMSRTFNFMRAEAASERQPFV